MNSREYIKKFVNSYCLFLFSGYIISINLVYPKFSVLSVAIQLFSIYLWIYIVHIILHMLPESKIIYHIYSHHNKNLKLPWCLEIIAEFFNNFSAFISLVAIKYMFGMSYLSYTLVIFYGLWYSSVHLIQYSLLKSSEHEVHHKERKYNFGPGFYDMLFGTLKSNNSEVPLYQINNGIVIFLLFNMLSKYYGFSLQV